MSKSSQSSSGSGIGCLAIPIWVLVIAALSGAWMWSNGMEPREAVALGLEYGVYGASLICMLPCILLVAIVGGLTAFGAFRR